MRDPLVPQLAQDPDNLAQGLFDLGYGERHLLRWSRQLRSIWTNSDTNQDRPFKPT